MADGDMKTPPDLGVEIGGPGRVYFDDVVVDNLMDAVIELSAALWTVRDRQIVLEKVLAEKGVDVAAAIERHMPDAEEHAARQAERDALAQRIFKSFLRRPTADAAKDHDAPSLRQIED
ncbi:MAG: hypothetical protein MI723_03290 [Caulobacterales bacterium]|nr:hypothetical protein [Caulobacterales bacterium]